MVADEQDEGGRQFRFEASWTTEEGCEDEIRRLWTENQGTVPEKLRLLGEGLNQWGQDLKAAKSARCDFLKDELDRLISLPPSDDNLLNSIAHQVELNLEIDRQEIAWEQRAHAHWMQEGEKNTAFFHKFATQRKRRNRITGIEDNSGNWKNSANGIAAVATEYFETLYTTQGVEDNSVIMNGVRNLLPP